MRNVWVLLAGAGTYLVLAPVLGFLALGVGFMDEPSRTIYGHAIVLIPLLIAGIVVGRIAVAHAMWLAIIISVAALATFLLLATGPIPFILADSSGKVVTLLQGAYQFALYVGVSMLGAWIGARLRRSSLMLKGTPA